jgi:hypothetical protein
MRMTSRYYTVIVRDGTMRTACCHLLREFDIGATYSVKEAYLSGNMKR